MAQYALLVWGPVDHGEHGFEASAEEHAAQLAATGALNDRLRAEGSFVFANGLAAPSASTVVDGRGPSPVLTDGPYLETKEYMAGLWIIDVDDLDAALKIATEASTACGRPLEVRPVHGG